MGHRKLATSNHPKPPAPAGGQPDGALTALQNRLGHRFGRVQLLERALTHRSFARDHNERLEFLGDAVLDLVVAHLLFDALGDSAEGDLSRGRANLVREESLHRLALRLQLPDMLRLGAGEKHAGGATRPSILADALEAIVGAIYLDAGYAAADAVVRRWFGDVALSPAAQQAAKDAKTALQEWLQGHKMQLPQYEVLHVSGAAHEQTFEVACRVVDADLQTLGRGPSHRKAEQVAAAAMLAQLKSTK